ncbi:hypothetical protein L3Y34_000348 [Caenorhabditis briggsae]|uniref:Uncharacterized protein n=1 Tax=Caenorhabditis briggsae TaxID=6238 RepID=A0AAE9ILT0_CAEBR|nr:hypothetical protein L3Y34_000348 [Caenorhabditis briggsae]
MKELEENIKILEKEFSRVSGKDAHEELKHDVQQNEIRGPDELQMAVLLLGLISEKINNFQRIRKLENELEDIARRRNLPGTNLMTNASQKSRAKAALKLAKLNIWKIVLATELIELEPELDVDKIKRNLLRPDLSRFL